MQWVRRLAAYWDDFAQYYNQERIALVDAFGQTDTFVKSYKNFTFYDNLRAGHAVSTGYCHNTAYPLNQHKHKLTTNSFVISIMLFE